MYVCMYVCMYECMYVHMYYMSVYLYECVYICVCMFYSACYFFLASLYPMVWYTSSTRTGKMHNIIHHYSAGWYIHRMRRNNWSILSKLFMTLFITSIMLISLELKLMLCLKSKWSTTLHSLRMLSAHFEPHKVKENFRNLTVLRVGPNILLFGRPK